MTHHAYRIHEHKDSMASEARKQLFMFNLANRIIFCGPKSAEAASIVGGDGCPDLGRRVASGMPDCRQQ